MSSTDSGASARLRWRRTWVHERPALYGVAGDDDGLPVLFLHGWALGHRSYRTSIDRLVGLGCRVLAPALPGFGGTADLPRREFSIAGYARWVDGFLDAVGADEPVIAVGHSFGGGTAIAFAHRFPERTRSLVLVNSIGGATWGAGARVRSIAERPIWHWGVSFPADIWPLGQAVRVLPAVLEEAVPNLVRNPAAVWRVGMLARRADLTRELQELRERRLPVVALWGTRDAVIPREAFESLCTAIGATGEIVDGSHSWLLADPERFGALVTNAVEVAHAARRLERQPDPPTGLRRFASLLRGDRD